MNARQTIYASAGALRRELSALNLVRGERHEHETTFGNVASVIYSSTDVGGHGNFLDASYKRIYADAEWRKRLDKAYTAGSRVPRQWERRRSELECATSSDALLMNVFCYPRLLHSSQVCSLLGIEPGLRPEFGVRAHLAMRNGEIDRTELDMQLGPLLIEAKLTESSFGTASRQRLLRYVDLDAVFDTEALPWSGDKVAGYQLIRGVLAAYASDKKYVLVCDGRRADLQETWFRVLRAVRHCDVRSRMALLSWQELAAKTPVVVRVFLRDKYGICGAA